MPAHIFSSKGPRLENIAIVLASPKNPGNVGAVARAMKNMGFRDLRLVNPLSLTWQDAIRMACGAEDLLEKAQITGSLAEAFADIDWVIGTSARKRRYNKNVFLPREIIDHTVSISHKNKVAFLFGSEKYGLTTEEISFCNQLVSIPTQKNFSSLNLSQAVLIIAWELSQAQENNYELPYQPKLASHKELHDLFLHLEKVLMEIEFITEENSRHMMLSIKTMVRQKTLSSREVKILRGVLRNLRRSNKLSSANVEITNCSQ